jgi:hypothetical protein
MPKKITLQPSVQASLEIHRHAIMNEKLVYVIVMARQLKYPHGKSKIAYIGTTAAGINRIASSGAYRAKTLLTEHGQKSLKLFTVTCSKRSGVKNAAKKLENALLATFRKEFGKVPNANKQGKNVNNPAALKYFTRARLEAVIEKYSNLV